MPIAVTRIIPMHINKGKTVLQSLSARLNYATNPNKTKNGELVTAYACDPHTADAEFALSRRQYQTYTGRTQKHEVIAYQVRQSFKPGEVTPEEANAIGYEFASRFLKGNHAFIIATHCDVKHIHNHIEWNAVSLDAHHKFKDFSFSARAVARLSDMICLEHKLSVVKHPQHTGKTYNKWLGEKAVPNHRDVLRTDIDQVLEQKPTNMDALLDGLKTMGYEIKRGKYTSVKGARQKRFIRFKTLGAGYSEEEIKAVLAGRAKHHPHQKQPPKEQTFQLLVDIQAKLAEGKGGGYERWAKKHNLKAMAQTLILLQEKGLLNEDALDQRIAELDTKFHESLAVVKDLETRMADNKTLRRHAAAYTSTKNIAQQLKTANRPAAFEEQHRAELTAYRAAAAYFKANNLTKLPSPKKLEAEYAQLASEKAKFYEQYKEAKEELLKLKTAKQNVASFFREEEPAQQER